MPIIQVGIYNDNVIAGAHGKAETELDFFDLCRTYCILVSIQLIINILYEPNAVCWPISPRDCHFFQGTVHVLGP